MGRCVVPEGPVDLPLGEVLEVQVTRPVESGGGSLAKLAELARSFPPDPDSPGDAAAQHDHYLYGTPKKMVGEYTHPTNRRAG